MKETQSIDNDFTAFAYCFNCISYNSKTQECAMQHALSQKHTSPTSTCSYFTATTRALISIDYWHKKHDWKGY